ncbi:dienelactone hydrolase family protein [Mucilaginibacter sp. X5P1]|uniref:dienelactone hydrolase family protein n=1 Tax=Mucilaginibacter sp. X5P1 TaxID=2723088 RepID=UPI0016118AC6|nr:dienelactone hydrolase family protein [Mucilaginibacter sp. X5P1]MBB6140442.1 carboxymethylenebutenolidase [Mucilaginibacter sp. X5P1]
MENQQNYVTLHVTDGSNMAAYTAFPQNKTTDLPAIILLQEAFGVNHHIRNVADRFAKDGYAVIVPELFHRTAPVGFEGAYNDFPSVMPHMQALTTDGLIADLNASHQWLTEQGNIDNSKIFSIGYCLGGRVSFLANAILPLKAGVSYYGGGMDQYADKAANLYGKHLFFWGGLDKHIKQENINNIINAVDAAGKDYINVKISYADHGFNCDEKPSYNKVAAKEALALTLAFLN